MTRLDLYLRITLALVLGYSAYTKLVDLRGFGAKLQELRILRWPPGSSLGIALLEISVASLLLSPFRAPNRVGYSATLALLVIYSVVLTQQRAEGKQLSCACMGSDMIITSYSLVRNVTLIALASSGLLVNASQPALHVGWLTVAIFNLSLLTAAVAANVEELAEVGRHSLSKTPKAREVN